MASTSPSPASFETEFSFVNVVTDGTWPDSWGKPPKTRKRITKEQLELLEGLFAKRSHPTREERQMLADKTGMELRSVTIWLQNKRQLIKKNAKASAQDPSSSGSGSSTPTSASSPPARATESPAPSEEERPTTRARARPSLDRVASLSEYPSPVRPITHKNTSQPEQPLLSHMPSSPPDSPPRPSSAVPTRSSSRVRNLHKTAGRPYPTLSRTASVDSAVTDVSSASSSTTASSSRRQREAERAKLVKPGMTLEWACAQAAKRPSHGDEEMKPVVKEEDVEASSDEMQAALALCGLLNS